MPRNQKSGTARIDLDITAEAHLRLAAIHKALGFKTKTETFEALVFSISAKDVIDPGIMERLETKLDQALEAIDSLTERAVCQRIDSDKIVFAPRLNAAHLEALRNAQTAEAIRLQQSYRSIRNLEAAIATKQQVLTAKRNVNFVSRLMGRRKPKLMRTVEKLAAAVDRRSLREMQNLLSKSSATTAPSTIAIRKPTDSTRMPIEAPSHAAIRSRAINSEFVICQNFVFRPANVDGFS